MSEEKRYSHITVNAGDDDDIVIQAGAYRAADQASPADGQPAPQPAAEPQVEPEPEPEPQPQEAPAAQGRPEGRRKEPAYAEQTLADLEAGPMSGMQKAVLVGVGVIIVAAIVYFALFMR